MKIFTSSHIRELDAYTIAHEPIRSIDLMERAAKTLTRAISDQWSVQVPVVVFAGPGNNGGDALAVARMLSEQGYDVSTYLFNINGRLSEDCTINRQRILDSRKMKEFHEIIDEFEPPKLESGTLVVDGLFGSGLTKPLAGGFASLIKYINQSPATVVSIDVPSGLMTEDNTYNVRANIIKADVTLTLHQKKLSFLFAENQHYIGKLRILDIRLSQEGIDKINTKYTLQEENDVRALLKRRDDFAHKGSMGKALLIAGSYGMAGAATLAANACMRSGVGKLEICTPRRNGDILQITAPEAVLHIDREEFYFTNPIDATDVDALAIGPGIGQQENTSIAMITQIRRTTCPIVLDADALNILANHHAWLQQLPHGTIMTPHPKEFDLISGGPCADSFERISKASNLAESLQSYIILKGHYSALCMPDGQVIFNSTGNAGMATAGSGDVLTGIILALLARGYKQSEACQLGMYLHGLAGDIAARDLGMESLIARDIIAYLPKAFKRLED